MACCKKTCNCPNSEYNNGICNDNCLPLKSSEYIYANGKGKHCCSPTDDLNKECCSSDNCSNCDCSSIGCSCSGKKSILQSSCSNCECASFDTGIKETSCCSQNYCDSQNVKKKVDQNSIQLLENDNYKYFQNWECPFFPCHDNIPLEDFNCLFCYCPLYALGEYCGGDFRIIKDKNNKKIKDCSNCLFPHKINNFEKMQNKIVKKLIPKVTEEINN